MQYQTCLKCLLWYTVPLCPCQTLSHFVCSCQSIQMLFQQFKKHLQAGIAQWSEWWTCDQKVMGSSPGRSGRKVFFSRVNFLCWLLFGILSTPVLTVIKNPGHFAKSASGCLQLYTQCMRLYMKWCDMVYSCVVYTEHTKMAAVLSGTSHVWTTETVLQVLHHLDGYSKHAVIIIIHNSYKLYIIIAYISIVCVYTFFCSFLYGALCPRSC